MKSRKETLTPKVGSTHWNEPEKEIFKKRFRTLVAQKPTDEELYTIDVNGGVSAEVFRDSVWNKYLIEDACLKKAEGFVIENDESFTVHKMKVEGGLEEDLHKIEYTIEIKEDPLVYINREKTRAYALPSNIRVWTYQGVFCVKSKKFLSFEMMNCKFVSPKTTKNL